MKEITIIWINNKEARIITCNPYDILVTSNISSQESELPQLGMTPEFRKQKAKVRVEFYSAIVSEIESSREIVLFGPDNFKEEFLDYLDANESQLFAKVIGVESSLDMPEEKIIARGRKYL
jgi:stalled ribosome rescue protein Dom34